MDSFKSYILRQAYQKISRLGDHLTKVDQAIDWEAFRPIVKAMYRNDTEKGGCPNLDAVMKMKLLVLQAWYRFTNPELKRQVANRISFQQSLGYPEQLPDYSTVHKLPLKYQAIEGEGAEIFIISMNILGINKPSWDNKCCTIGKPSIQST